MAVDVLLGTLYIDGFIRRTLPEERKVVPMHLGLVPIPTRQVVQISRPMTHLEPSNTASTTYQANVRFAKQVIPQPRIKTRVNTATPVSGLSSFDPAQLN